MSNGAGLIVLVIIILVCVAIFRLQMRVFGHRGEHGDMINPEAVNGKDGECYIPSMEEKKENLVLYLEAHLSGSWMGYVVFNVISLAVGLAVAIYIVYSWGTPNKIDIVMYGGALLYMLLWSGWIFTPHCFMVRPQRKAKKFLGDRIHNMECMEYEELVPVERIIRSGILHAHLFCAIWAFLLLMVVCGLLVAIGFNLLFADVFTQNLLLVIIGLIVLALSIAFLVWQIKRYNRAKNGSYEEFEEMLTSGKLLYKA